MPLHLTKSRRRSPASLFLDTLGISQARLADTLGVSQSSLSRILAGEQRVPDSLGPVLRALVGTDDAARVIAAIGETRR